MNLLSRIQKLSKGKILREGYKMDNNTIKGIFEKKPNSWIVIIETERKTFETMEISAPFPIKVSRLLNNGVESSNNIGITFPAKEDPEKIETYIHPMAEEDNIDISTENNFNLLIVDIDKK